jgi:3-hydroxyacyl-[acyl-carrier-protein] dehydratase
LKPRGIDELVPHRPPFRFVDELVTVEAERGEFILRLAVEDTRLHEGVLSPLLLVEALAQATAGHHAFLHPEAAAGGMLVELADVQLFAPARGGERVTLVVEKTREHGVFARFTGRALVDGRVLAEAQLTVVRTETTRA